MSQLQRGPSPLAGIGSRDHQLPSGLVPWFVKTGPLTGILVPLPSSSACLVWSKSSGCDWKHASVSGLSAGQSR